MTTNSHSNHPHLKATPQGHHKRHERPRRQGTRDASASRESSPSRFTTATTKPPSMQRWQIWLGGIVQIIAGPMGSRRITSRARYVFFSLIFLLIFAVHSRHTTVAATTTEWARAWDEWWEGAAGARDTSRAPGMFFSFYPFIFY
jgi:hypothetical protein